MLPTFSPSQFVAALAEYASTPEFKADLRVSLAGMTISGKGVADHIASCYCLLAHSICGSMM